MSLKQINLSNFKKEILESDKPSILDFWAPWCGPCLVLGPQFEEISENYEGKIIFGKVNVDENKDIASSYGIRGIPTMIILKDGKEVDRIVGLAPKQTIMEKLDSILSK